MAVFLKGTMVSVWRDDSIAGVICRPVEHREDTARRVGEIEEGAVGVHIADQTAAQEVVVGVGLVGARATVGAAGGDEGKEKGSTGNLERDLSSSTPRSFWSCRLSSPSTGVDLMHERSRSLWWADGFVPYPGATLPHSPGLRAV